MRDEGLVLGKLTKRFFRAAAGWSGAACAATIKPIFMLGWDCPSVMTLRGEEV